MTRDLCYVCRRPERLLPLSRRLRTLGSFRNGRTLYVCRSARCREVAAELADILARIAPENFVRGSSA